MKIRVCSVTAGFKAGRNIRPARNTSFSVAGPNSESTKGFDNLSRSHNFIPVVYIDVRVARLVVYRASKDGWV